MSQQFGGALVASGHSMRLKRHAGGALRQVPLMIIVAGALWLGLWVRVRGALHYPFNADEIVVIQNGVRDMFGTGPDRHLGTNWATLVFAASIANRWFVKRRGLVIGLLTAATASGQLVFLPGLSMLAQSVGWRSVSLTVAAGALVMVPVVWLFLLEWPADAGQKPYGAAPDWEPPARSAGNAAWLALHTLRDAAKVRDFWYIAGSFFVCGLSTSGLIGTHFIPAAHDHGMPELAAASLLALVGVFDVVGTIFSGWLTDRYDARRLLFVYYLLRGISLFLLPWVLFSTVQPSTLVFVVFYGLDWVATVPPTVLLCRMVLGRERGTVVYGWVFAAHQVGGSIAALGAALLRVQFGNYALAFYASGLLCVVTAYFVLQIAREVPAGALPR